MTLEIGKNNQMLKPDMFYSVLFGSNVIAVWEDQTRKKQLHENTRTSHSHFEVQRPNRVCLSLL